jgi:hypothetical protein
VSSLEVEGMKFLLDAAPVMLAGGILFAGLARLVNAWFNGRAKLVRAERGDPEIADQSPTLRRVLHIQSRKRDHDA